MPDVEIYTSALCGYCTMAKRLLERKGVEFEEWNVSFKPGLRREMMARTEGRYTTPQIFIGEQGVGGCDELYDLESSGELDRLLGRASSS